MADTADTMATVRRVASNRSAQMEQSLEDQVARLQDDIRTIGASLAKLSDQKISEARGNARVQYSNLVASGQHAVGDLTDQVTAYENQLAGAIREKPLTAVAGAIGVGYLIAMLSRR